ncbi:MAG: ATP-dependent Clp protease ATP-binding subunit ClpX, partial [Cyanobacteria bacterium P01_C01_bin.69]
NILFVCGGAFVGLDKIVEQRIGKKSMGFVQPGKDISRDENSTLTLQDLEPDDIVKFGMIPEFIGRIPAISIVEPLDEKTLVSILTEPKNALVKQFKKLMRMDNVDLDFEPDAVRAIAKEAFNRKTGARALRSIIEEIMLDVMYELPSRDDVKTCTITRQMVENRSTADLLVHPSSIPEPESA